MNLNSPVNRYIDATKTFVSSSQPPYNIRNTCSAMVVRVMSLTHLFRTLLTEFPELTIVPSCKYKILHCIKISCVTAKKRIYETHMQVGGMPMLGHVSSVIFNYYHVLWSILSPVLFWCPSHRKRYHPFVLPPTDSKNFISRVLYRSILSHDTTEWSP